VPLVLHGGSGIRKAYLQQSFQHGIAKINIGTAVRQPYEALAGTSAVAAVRAVYETVTTLLRDELEIAGSARVINPD